MNPTRRTKLIVSLGLSGALVAGMAGLAATAVTAAPSPDKTLAEAREALAKGKIDKAIKLAEAAVAGNPREGSYRALLGQAYLRAGRFASAATAFDDAMKLGENGAKTALGLALADAAQGKGREAVGILDDWRDAIPASDLGLALALSGETSRGVAILADAVRGGDASTKARQNLAYSYALDGRWREARLMLSQDIAPDAVDRRLGDWAMLARPDEYKVRIAKLINAPLRDDPGQPAALALAATPPASEQAAAETGAIRAAKTGSAAPAGELPAVGSSPAPTLTPAAAQALASYAPVSPAAPLPAASPAPAPASFAAAFPAGSDKPALVIQPDSTPAAAAEPAEPAAAPAAARPAPAVHHANPVALAAPRAASHRAPDHSRSLAHAAAPRAPGAPHAAGTHLVQLGSFSSAQGARRAWGLLAARNPQLRQFKMVITPATVRGHAFWRVAAAGFDRGAARGMCNAVRSRGGACFAYAASARLAPAAPHAQMAHAGVHHAPAKPAVRMAIAHPAKPAPKAAPRPATARPAAGPALARRH